MPHSRPRETAQFIKAAGQLGPYTKARRGGKENRKDISGFAQLGAEWCLQILTKG